MTAILDKAKKLRRFFIYYNVFNYAAQLAYSLMLALLPLLMVFSWALQFLSSHIEVSVGITEFIDEYLPQSLANYITPMLRNPNVHIEFTPASIIANIALIFFIVYAAVRIMRSIKVVFTQLCDQKEDRSFIIMWLTSIRDLFILLLIISSTVYLYIEARIILVNFLKTFTNESLAQDAENFWNRLIFIYVAIVFTLTLNWILAKFPAKKFSYWRTLPSTVFVLAGWLLLSRIFNLISSVLEKEGALGIINGGVGITVSIYFISLILVLGEILNYYLEKNQVLKKLWARYVRRSDVKNIQTGS